jgi:acyl carrier protein
MKVGENNKKYILSELIGILEDMTSDWDFDYLGGINAETRLVEDLTFESVEVVQLMVTIEQHFNLKNLASEKLLMRDGSYVPDLKVAEIRDFLCEEMSHI